MADMAHEKPLQFQSCAPPYSFYELRDRLFEAASTSSEAFHRFLSLMRIVGATAFLEQELSVQEDIELEYEMRSTSSRCHGEVSFKAHRLIFAWIDEADAATVDATSLDDDHFVGYCTIVQLTLPDGMIHTYVFEAIVRPPGRPRFEPKFIVRSLSPYYYFHCTKTFAFEIPGRKNPITIQGSFFTQQNKLTHVCAHAAIRIALNSSSAFTSKTKLTNRHINEILGLTFEKPESFIGTYSRDKQVKPTRETGLTKEEIIRVIELFGLATILDCQRNTNIEYDHFAYPYMESGWPVLVGLEGTDFNTGEQLRHVVSILGHTLNPFQWSPLARRGYGTLPRMDYLSAVEWTDHFIISDEGFGMYQTLQSDSIRNIIVPAKNASLHATFVVAITPKEVTFPGWQAESIAANMIRNFVSPARRNHFRGWFKRLSDCPNMVCRTLWVTRDEHRRELATHDDFHKFEQSTIEYLDQLPQAFWVTEISMPPLYCANGKKLGEVIIRCDGDHTQMKMEDAWNHVAMLWLPGVALFRLPSKDLISISWPIRSPAYMIRARRTEQFGPHD